MADRCLVDHHGYMPLRRALVYEREEPVFAQFSNDTTEKTNKPLSCFLWGLGVWSSELAEDGNDNPCVTEGVKE